MNEIDYSLHSVQFLSSSARANLHFATSQYSGLKIAFVFYSQTWNFGATFLKAVAGKLCVDHERIKPQCQPFVVRAS